MLQYSLKLLAVESIQFPSIDNGLVVSIFSVIVSLALAILYYMQKGLLEKQTEIMQAAHRPVVDAEKIIAVPTDENELQRNGIQLDLRNVGNEVAINPQLQTKLTIPEKGIKGKERLSPLKRESTGGFGAGFENLSTALPVEESAEYTTPVMADFTKSSADEEKYIGTVLADLFTREIERVKIDIGVLVENVSGEEYYQRYLQIDFDFDEFVAHQEEEGIDESPMNKLKYSEVEEISAYFSFENVFRYGVISESRFLLPFRNTREVEWSDKMDMISNQILEEAADLLMSLEEEQSDKK